MHGRTAYRRHMPHYQNFGGTYLTTFVTRNRWTLPPAARTIALMEIIEQHRKTAFIHTAVVMPDHVHIVLQPLIDDAGWCYGLSRILRTIKGRSARFINIRLCRARHVWQEESNDCELRRDESVREKCEYVARNPVRMGLANSPDEYRWLWRWWVDDDGPAEARPTKGRWQVARNRPTPAPPPARRD